MALLAALGVVVIMAFVQRFAVPVAPPQQVELTGKVSPAARAVDPAQLALGPPEPALPRCLCRRADSPLWKDGLPVLSLLPSAGPEDGGRPIEHEEGRYKFDLAVVNNGAAPLRDVHVLLTFARRDQRGARKGITERGLFWEGELGPGRAVKWDVSAKGTEVKVEPGVTAALDDATGAAPPDAFFELTRARYRVVRIHAAMMLAYLRDPRVHEALAVLGAPAPPEQKIIGMIRRAAAEVVACDVTAAGGRLRACVLNAGVTPVRGAVLREVAEGSTDAGAARRWPIGSTLPVHDGIRIDIQLEGPANAESPKTDGEPPAELVVDAKGN
jgi:hypothetical protein